MGSANSFKRILSLLVVMDGTSFRSSIVNFGAELSSPSFRKVSSLCSLTLVSQNAQTRILEFFALKAQPDGSQWQDRLTVAASGQEPSITAS